MATIITPRPPLNLFEVVRTEVDDTWTTIYDVPNYTIPASGPNPQRTVGAAAIMTGLAVCPLTLEGASIAVRVENAAGTETFLLMDGAFAPAGDFLSISLDRQVLKSGEKLQVKCATGQSVMTHFSFILNQREDFTEIPA
jgi:hypothetical protein